MRGKFITFEGCEGSGKSTQLKLLAARLDENGVDYLMTREPGGSQIAEKIREIILDAHNTKMCGECEALLYAAARIQHVKEIILPALEAGKLVICDRYVHSSLAYQGYARGLGSAFVENINAGATALCPPDLTLFLDISPDEAFERKHGADENDRMEMLGRQFHQRVYEGYCELLKTHPEMCAINCRGSKAQTAENIYKLLLDRGIVAG